MKNIIVLGSGRSGTSMVAGCFASAGYFCGERPYPARDSNPKGFFESPEINGVNEALLAPTIPRHPGLGTWQRWLAIAPPDVALGVTPALELRMARVAERTPFCLKDPRFCFTLPAWREHLGDHVAVCVFRDPAATAASIMKECASVEYLADVPMDRDRALTIWTAHYRAALQRQAEGGSFVFVHMDQMIEGDGLDTLARATGAPIDRSFPEGRLRRSAPEGEVPGEVRDLYRSLCAMAGYAPSHLPRVKPVRSVSTEQRPALSVILCTYNRRDVLAQSLPYWFAQTGVDDDFELVIVNDGSTDGTADLLDSTHFPVRHVRVDQPNGGLADARNAGLAAASGELMLLVNDDTLPFPDMVARHIAAHRARPGEKLVVLGTFEQPADHLDNALMRYLESSNEVFCYPSMTPGGLHDWTRFWTCNVSVPAEAMAAVGPYDVSFRHYGCEDTDLGYRLHRAGYRVLYDPTVRAHHLHFMDFDEIRRRANTVARAWVRFFRKHPATLEHPDWRWVTALHAQGIESTVVDHLPQLAVWEAAARTLAELDLGSFERVHESFPDLSETIVTRLGDLIRPMNRLWWLEGLGEGLREQGARRFSELQDQPPYGLDDGFTAVAAPDWANPTGLRDALRTFLAGQLGPLLLLAEPEAGWSLGSAEHILHSLDLDDERLIVHEVGAGRGGLTTATRAAPAWLPLPGAASTRLGNHCSVLGIPPLAPPLELATDARQRLLAWPDYSSDADLAELLGAFGPLLRGRDDAVLCLRLDPVQDVKSDVAIARLQAAFDRYLGADAELQVLLVDNPLGPTDWRRLGEATTGAIVLPSTRTGIRKDMFENLGVPLMSDPKELAALLQ